MSETTNATADYSRTPAHAIDGASLPIIIMPIIGGIGTGPADLCKSDIDIGDPEIIEIDDIDDAMPIIDIIADIDLAHENIIAAGIEKGDAIITNEITQNIGDTPKCATPISSKIPIIQTEIM